MALISVSGHLKDPSGANIAGSVVFQLVNYGGAIPRVIGTNALVPTNVTFTAGANGAWSGNIQSNDSIDPGASNTPPTTYYTVQFRDANGAEIQTVAFNFTGAGPANLDSQAPLVTIPLPTAPPNTAGLLAGNQTWTGVNTFTGANVISAKSIENIRFADQFAGADIFAQANAASIAASPKGCVVIPPGTYSVSTTLTLQDNVPVLCYGVKVTYTGTGTAVLCANMGHAGIKNLQLVGPGTGGSTIGLQLGIGSGGLNIDTAYNHIEDVQINNFNKGFVLEGYALNGTYGNRVTNMNNTSNNINFYLVPTSANFANFNIFTEVDAVTAVSDGYRIDGSNGNIFCGVRAEANGGWGWNFTGTSATNGNSFFGVWGEGNTSGDFNSANTNITQTTIKGGFLTSSPNFSANWNNSGNYLEIQNRRDNYLASGSTGTIHFISTSANNYAVLQNDHPSPPSGIIGVQAYNVTGSNAGNLYLGSPEFPPTFRGNLNTAVLTGASSGNSVTLLNYQTAKSAITGTGADAALYTYTLPANTVATGKGLRISASWSHSTGAASVVYKLKINGTALAAPGGITTAGAHTLTLTVMAAASTTFDLPTFWLATGSTLQSTTGSSTSSGGMSWTSNQTVELDFNVAATDQVTPGSFVVELVQ